MGFYSPEQIEALSSRTPKHDFLVELQFRSETMYVWNGFSELESGGRTWRPLRGTGQIEGIELAQNQESAAVRLQLSGVGPDEFLSKALEQTPDVVQQSVIIYSQFFDDEWQPIGDPLSIFHGYMQPPEVERTAMIGGDGAVQTIKVDAENAFFNRSKPSYGRLTDRDQQSRFPGDRFLSFMTSLRQRTFTYPDY